VPCRALDSFNVVLKAISSLNVAAKAEAFTTHDAKKANILSLLSSKHLLYFCFLFCHVRMDPLSHQT
jgi:hypothetical protein